MCPSNYYCLGLDTTDISRGSFPVLLSWRTSDFELYAAFDPLADKVRLDNSLPEDL